METLNGDRDRLFTRLSNLEQGLDVVTGSIKKIDDKPASPPWPEAIDCHAHERRQQYAHEGYDRLAGRYLRAAPAEFLLQRVDENSDGINRNGGNADAQRPREHYRPASPPFGSSARALGLLPHRPVTKADNLLTQIFYFHSCNEFGSLQ